MADIKIKNESGGQWQSEFNDNVKKVLEMTNLTLNNILTRVEELEKEVQELRSKQDTAAADSIATHVAKKLNDCNSNKAF